MRVRGYWTEESRFARLTCPSKSFLVTFHTGEVGTANQTIQDRGPPGLVHLQSTPICFLLAIGCSGMGFRLSSLTTTTLAPAHASSCLSLG